MQLRWCRVGADEFVSLGQLYVLLCVATITIITIIQIKIIIIFLEYEQNLI